MTTVAGLRERDRLHHGFTPVYAASECWVPKPGLTEERPINFVKKQDLQYRNSSKKISQKNELLVLYWKRKGSHQLFECLRYFRKLAILAFHSEAGLFGILFPLPLPKAGHRRKFCVYAWNPIPVYLSYKLSSCSLKFDYLDPSLQPFICLHSYTLAQQLWNNFFKRSDLLILTNMLLESCNRKKKILEL